MRIKSLEMSGFKSFVDRTVVNFEEGLTGVVGPNGCGKSNLVDAVRWVMGEMSAKHLRGSAMEDVIFNGCESRPATGMSQVFLTFDNADGRAPADYAQYSEIQVGRRLYRSGESEYFINKTPCRLKDIIDLFLGTGVGTKAYSIVEQGTVGSIVSAKPEDRRMLIEEAAGISKFKSRKEAALRKMEATRANLARLTDILAELTRQMNSLNRQAKKAERYKKIAEELKGRELALSATRFRVLRTEMDALESEHNRLREAEVSSSSELSGFENELEARRLEIAELERELDGASQELYRVQNSIKLYEADIGHKKSESQSVSQQNIANSEELSTRRAQLADLNSRIDAANSQCVLADLTLSGASEDASRSEAEAGEVRACHVSLQRSCEEYAAGVMECSKDIANLSASLDHLERRHIEITARIAKNQTEIDGIDRRRKQLESDLSKRSTEIDGVRQLKFSIVSESESLATTLTEQQRNLDEACGRVQKLRDDITDRNSRFSSIEELRKNLEGYRDGVKAVMTRTDADGRGFEGIVGTIGELFETSTEYEPALGAVLGEKLQYVVVKSHKEGVEAIDYLRTAACGRSSFIPVGVRAAEDVGPEPSGDGVMGPMHRFVSFSDQYHTICRHLLGDVVLVDNLRRALSLWESGKFRRTFVTKDGCVVDPSGVVTGGAGGSVEEQLIAQKRRSRELSDEIAVLRGQLTTADGEAEKLRQRVLSIESRAGELGRNSHSEDLRLVGQERDIERLRDELVRYEAERDKLSVETAVLTEELSELGRETAEKRSLCDERTKEHGGYEEKLVTARRELDELGVVLRGREAGLVEQKIGLAQAEERATSASRELESLVRMKAETVLAVGRRLAEINMSNQRLVILGREIENLKSNLDLSVMAVRGLEKAQRELRDSYDGKSNGLRQRELEIRDIRKRHDEALSSFHGVELKLTEHRAKLKYLADGVSERYHLGLASIESEYAREGLDMDAEEQKVSALKEKIEGIGSVNVDAIDEFRELSERNEFMSKQHMDLTASLDNLSKAIAKINRTSRQRFRRAFDSVDAQFQVLFPKLFNGGRARLMLTDDENVLESGIEIIAQPPGKKLQSITLLSGGEKALTAVALIFSIFLIKPSPFCLLDEVDAPLDDANIDRFNELIRSMTPHSQFILITHNKRTMELADVLYGVTMEEAGVSKMVSVRLGQENREEPKVA